MARSARTGVIAATVVVLGHLGVLVLLLAGGAVLNELSDRGYSIWVRVPEVPTEPVELSPVFAQRADRPTAVVPVVPVVADERSTNTAPPRGTAPRALDLRVPADLLAAPEPERADGPGWVFDRKLARRLDAARNASASRQLRADRQRAREGVSSDEYQRGAALGERMKTAAGCFELREDPDNGGTRWWREACTDIQKSPWEQAPLAEYPEAPQ